MSPLRVILAGVGVAAVAGPTLVVVNAPVVTPRPRVVLPRPRVVPQAELPAVEPVKFVDLAPEDARAFNAGVPFSTNPNPAARPFRFVGSDEARARATDCLATAVLYEAGDDAVGERAVAQVVLNRLRHPAFPKTVCGVIFEGQDRATGCQFSFSCDGAIRRWQPSEVAWTRAREVAAAALSGSVYRPVGYATHYHTDWVVPYWQSSLDKIAAVHSHLFFRWSGWWGTPPAFRRQPAGDEPVIVQLAAISDAHRTGAAMDEAEATLAEASAAMGFSAAAEAGVPVQTAGAMPVDGDSVFVALPRGFSADTLPVLAAQACGERPFCRYLAWADRTRVATSVPLAPQQTAALTFSYLRDKVGGYEKSLWNCQQVKRADPAQCMRVQATITAVPVAKTALVAEPLEGVRRVQTAPATPIAAPPLSVTPAVPRGPAGPSK